MRKTLFLFAAASLLALGAVQAEPPPVQKPSMSRPQPGGPAQPRVDPNRFQEKQKPQALGRQGNVSMEEEEEEAQARPSPMRDQAGRQAAPMRAPAQQMQGR